MLCKQKRFFFGAILTAVILVGCGGSGDGEGSIDVAEYMPQEDVNQTYRTYTQWGTAPERESTYDQNTTVQETATGMIVVSLVNGIEVKRDIVYKNNVTSVSAFGGFDMASDRYVDVGETFLYFSREMDLGGGIRPTVTLECTLESQLDNFSSHGHSYAGEILKIQCVYSSTDIEIDGVTYHPYSLTYRYIQKGVGVIAEIEDHCSVAAEVNLDNDRNLDTCTAALRHHQYRFLE